jgi:hypothetical protein
VRCVLCAYGGIVDGAEKDGFAGLKDWVSVQFESDCDDILTAYAIRSPFASDERIVGCPRVVVGEAAQIASIGFVSL